MENEKYDLSYSSLWKSIIRPPRDKYTIDILGDEIFSFKGITYLRKDYDIINNRGEILKCSFVEPTEDSRPSEIMPVVLYLHGNSSSRIEGLKCLPELLKRHINLFVFDFAGCGLSEGEYISLGYREKDDVELIVDFIEKIPRTGKIGLWGRSMGAATSLIFNSIDNRIIATVYDSPFSEFTKLSKELSKKHANIPNFLASFALTFIRSSIKDRNGLDIYKLNPIKNAEKVKIPGFFIHAMNDELIALEHTLSIFEVYKGEKSLNICEGGHNSTRQKHLLEKVAEFFKKHLFEDSNTNKEINLDSKDKGKKKYSDNKFNEDKDIIDDYVNINMDKFEKNSVKSISTNSLDQINDFEDLQSEINFENKLEDPLPEAGTFKAQKDMN